MVQSEGTRNLVCHYLVMVPSRCLMYAPPIDKYSKLLVLKFGIHLIGQKITGLLYIIP